MASKLTIKPESKRIQKNGSKTLPTKVSVDDFLKSISESRKVEAIKIINLMEKISGLKPVMWGSSIIGFGKMHYKYESGREVDMPQLGFSPRKANITIYFESFGDYGDLLEKLGKYKTSVGCLYISKLENVDLNILEQMIQRHFEKTKQRLRQNEGGVKKLGVSSVQQYVQSKTGIQKTQLVKMLSILRGLLLDAEEVISYQIPCFKVDGKNIVFCSAFKDHIGLYPVPKNISNKAKNYQKGKGTLWFDLDEDLPEEVIKEIVLKLKSDHLAV